MRFGAHSRTHPILSRATADRSRSEIVDSVNKVRTNAGPAASNTFAFPNGTPGDFGEREIGVLRELDITGAFASIGGRTERPALVRNPYAIPRVPYSDDFAGIRQALIGAERVKQALRGDW